MVCRSGNGSSTSSRSHRAVAAVVTVTVTVAVVVIVVVVGSGTGRGQQDSHAATTMTRTLIVVKMRAYLAPPSPPGVDPEAELKATVEVKQQFFVEALSQLSSGTRAENGAVSIT